MILLSATRETIFIIGRAPPMNDTNIACFLSVARTGSFTISAQELSSTQQAVSRNVQNLEDELGFALLNRSGRVVNLTSEGSRFYQWCLDGDRQVSLAVAAARRLMGNETNTLRLGWCDWTGCPDEIAEGIRAFTKTHDICELDFRQGSVENIKALLLDETLDLAILPEFYTHSMSGVTVSEPFMSLPLYAVTSLHHAFSGDTPTAAELTPMKHLVARLGSEAGGDVRKHIDYLCAELEIYPEHLEIMPNVPSTYSELLCGPCYTISPRTSYAQRRGDLRFHPLPVSIPLVFVRSHGNAIAWVPLFETFIRHWRDSL